MKFPNFFIIGSPRCGTTALSEYLRGHPKVFMSEHKEPHYFAEDSLVNRRVTNLPDYLELFNSRSSQHIAVGEASTRFFCSDVALGNISDFNKDAKLIVMLRNPIDLSYSLHSALLYTGEENIPDFKTAWDLQATREQGINLPEKCRTPLILQYRKTAMQGRHLKKAYEIFPRSQIKTIFFEDFTSNTRAVYEEVLAFLAVPSDHRTDFERINENKLYRFRKFGELIQKPPDFIYWFYDLIGKRPGSGLGWMAKLIRRAISKKADRTELDVDFRSELQKIFHDDVVLLEQLTNRDLKHWLL